VTPADVISIVVADDDDALRSVTAGCLRAAGMTVREAADGLQAVELVREHRPSVLVLDLWMPGLDGLQVLDALRFDPSNPRLSVVILTGDREADGRLLALAGGAARIVLKGGPVEELIEAVRSCAEVSLGPPFGIAPDPDDHDLGEAGAVSASEPAGNAPPSSPIGPDQP
jgi:CheY-like chemotaxis protein